MSGAMVSLGSKTAPRWQQRGSNSQSLLLSRTPVFGIDNHGAVLEPGMRYRLLSVSAGVAELEIETSESLEIGYCPSIMIGAHHGSGASGNRLRRWSAVLVGAGVFVGAVYAFAL